MGAVVPYPLRKRYEIIGPTCYTVSPSGLSYLITTGTGDISASGSISGKLMVHVTSVTATVIMCVAALAIGVAGGPVRSVTHYCSHVEVTFDVTSVI